MRKRNKEQILKNFLGQINAASIAEANLTPGQVEVLHQIGYGKEADERMIVIRKEEACRAERVVDTKFDDSGKTVKTPPKIGPDELGSAETRDHQLVESSSKTVGEPTVEIDFENDFSVFAVGGNEDELDVIPTRLAARLPASPDEPTLRELELSDFEEEEGVNVGAAPPSISPPAPQPQSAPQQPPAVFLGSSWSQEAPTTPRAPALQKKRRCFFGMTLHDLVLVLGAVVATVVLGTTFFELGRNRERQFWQKLFAERPVIEKACGEPTMVVLAEYRQPQSDARVVVAAPVQKPQLVIRRPAKVARRLPSPRPRPSEVEVPAIMGTYPLPAAGSARDSVLATLKRACGSDPRWIDANRSLLLDPAATTIRTVCRSDIARRLPDFVQIKDYPVFGLKIRQS